MKNKILFITEKWCDGKEEMGLTNSFHNIFGSFKRSVDLEKHNFSVFHFDECYIKLGTHIDSVKEKIYEQVKPDILICTLLGKSEMNPSYSFFEFFKNKNVKLCFMWPDIGNDFGMPEISKFESLNPVHISWAGERNMDSEKIKWLWTPEDPALYYPEEKTIDCSFMGTFHNLERVSTIQHVLSSGINMFVGEGQRSKKIDFKRYAEVMRKSKIAVNFSFSPSGFNQIKGRIFESAATKTLLLEKANDKIKHYFEPGKDYIEFSDKYDLVEKIKYYLSNDKERDIISNNFYEKYNKLYTSKLFWDKVLESFGE